VSGSQEYYFPDMPVGGDLLGDFLKQYYAVGRPLPDEVVLPGDLPDRKVLAEVLSDQRGKPVRLVVGAGKGRGGGEGEGADLDTPIQAHPPGGNWPRTNRGRLLGLAQENAWAALKRRQQLPPAGDPLADLQVRLKLPQAPRRLECLDISTLQGEQPVGALVAFSAGQPDKSGYRRFRIREVAGQDDYAMLREVVTRHYGKAGRELPDLLVVDGGRGQLNVVMQTLKELGLTEIPVVGLAKATEAGGRQVRDRLFLAGRKKPLLPPANAPGWLLLLRLRDETHRFAVTYHRKRARKELLASALQKAPGIGPVRKRRLLEHFPNLEAIKAATAAEIAALPGFNQRLGERLREWLDRAGEGT